jgi:hypothetical protein
MIGVVTLHRAGLLSSIKGGVVRSRKGDMEQRIPDPLAAL